MHKNTQHLHGGLRGFAAAAAIASLAAFGCTTNRTPGDGQPAMTAPSMPSSTPGTSSGTSNPPMASAYTTGVSVEPTRGKMISAMPAWTASNRGRPDMPMQALARENHGTYQAINLVPSR